MYCYDYKFFLLEYKNYIKIQTKIDECKTLNNTLWKCIDKKNDIYNCGKEYYYFIKCFHSINSINSIN